MFSTIGDRDVQGGSTITQQTVKNYYYDNERSFTRKLKELFVAHKVEQQYSKNEILSFYLNNIYYGKAINIQSKVPPITILVLTVNKNSDSMSQITVLQKCDIS